MGVDEEGVEGAAYTMIALAGAGMPDDTQKAQMILDRPFLFGIRDYRNDVWLFLGVCGNPAGEEESETASVTDPGGSISLRVPDGWVCEACPEGEDGFDYSLRLYPEGEETGGESIHEKMGQEETGYGEQWKEEQKEPMAGLRGSCGIVHLVRLRGQQSGHTGRRGHFPL